MIIFASVSALLAVLLAAEWRYARFSHLNKFADALELLIPKVLTYNYWKDTSLGGDPITWLHHVFWALLATGFGGLLAALSGWGVSTGAAIYAGAAFAFYVVREGAVKRSSAKEYLDGIMDVLGPASVFVAVLVFS